MDLFNIMLQFRKSPLCRWICLIAVLYCCVFEFKAAEFDTAEVARVIEETLKCHNNPGLAVSVVVRGKTIFSRGFGVKDVETKQPVTPDSLFGIASVSKSFAATLLVKLLYEETELTVDSRVQELLGERFRLMDEFRTKEATFADLMGHRMAIPANNRLRFDSNLTRQSLLERLPLLPSNDQFRVQHSYSNLFYGLVTYLAEVIGEDTWENLLTNHLLKPLGMDNTTFATTANLKSMPNLATGYIEFRNELLPVHPEFSRKWGLLAGSGAVMSTANDMTKWMNFHLREGRADDGKRIMASDHVEEVHKARSLTSFSSSLELRQPQFPIMTTQSIYAHGFRRGYYRGYERLVHSGSTLGYKALMSLLPAAQIGVFTAMTGVDTNYVYRSSLHYFLTDWALGLSESWLNATTICSFPEPWRRASRKPRPMRLDPSRKPALNISLFEGTYQNKAYGYLHVRYNESLETLTLDYGWGRWQLFYTPLSSSNDSTHRFYGKGIDITAINLFPMYFVQDSRGSEDVIVGMRATAFESKLPPVFVKLGMTKEAAVTVPDSATRFCITTHVFLLLFLIGLHLEIIF